MLAHRQLLLGAMALGVLVALGGATQAGGIAVPDCSFESPAGPPDSWLPPTASEWAESARHFGMFPGNGEFGHAAAPTDSNRMTFVETFNGNGSPGFSDTVEAGHWYQLEVDSGRRNPYAGNYAIDAILDAGGGTSDVVGSAAVKERDVTSDMFTEQDPWVTDLTADGAETVGVRFVQSGTGN